jgi:hypothetical protein
MTYVKGIPHGVLRGVVLMDLGRQCRSSQGHYICTKVRRVRKVNLLKAGVAP